MVEEGQVIEVAGQDVEAAIKSGLTRLGLTRDAVDVEVLDKGRQGMFGLGARAARVRLTVKSKSSPEPPTQSEPPSAPSPPPPPPTPDPEEETSPPEVAADVAADVPTEEPEEDKEPSEREKVQTVQDVVKDLLSTMELGHARVDVRRAKPGPNDTKVPPLVVDIRGHGTDILIGPNGEVLHALQTIVRLVVGREIRNWVHVVVDVEGYKEDRAKSLRDLAKRMADQAVKTDRTMILEPMPPHERRIVHMALHKDSRVTTESIYEGDRRRVTIVPQD